MSCGGESPADAAKIGPVQGIVGRKGEVRDAVNLGYVLSGQVELALEIDLGNGDITQGHTDILNGETATLPRLDHQQHGYMAATLNGVTRSPSTASLGSLNGGSSLANAYAHTCAYRNIAAGTGEFEYHEAIGGSSDR